jgi:2-polyprenyl-3-methyl-5-hydroxy-6-metoxy-1,4-benzoquinol methylase
VGIDLDEPSIEVARRHAKEAGVDDRLSFEVADAASPQLRGQFDAIFVFEALHDMARPVEVLTAIRTAPRGAGGRLSALFQRLLRLGRAVPRFRSMPAVVLFGLVGRSRVV